MKLLQLLKFSSLKIAFRMLSHISKILVIFCWFLVDVSLADSKQDCLDSVTRTKSYIELNNFVGPHTHVLSNFVITSKDLNSEDFQKNCLAAQENGKYLKDDLLKNNDCLKNHQKDLTTLVKFDKAMIMIDFWCNSEETVKKGNISS